MLQVLSVTFNVDAAGAATSARGTCYRPKFCKFSRVNPLLATCNSGAVALWHPGTFALWHLWHFGTLGTLGTFLLPRREAEV